MFETSLRLLHDNAENQIDTTAVYSLSIYSQSCKNNFCISFIHMLGMRKKLRSMSFCIVNLLNCFSLLLFFFDFTTSTLKITQQLWSDLCYCKSNSRYKKLILYSSSILLSNKSYRITGSVKWDRKCLHTATWINAGFNWCAVFETRTMRPQTKRNERDTGAALTPFLNRFIVTTGGRSLARILTVGFENWIWNLF